MLFFSCKKDPMPQPMVNILPEKSISASYGPKPLQNFDLYLPQGRTDTGTKLLIIIHGGAWVSGDKADMNFVMNDVKRIFPGWAVANINYTLATMPANNVFPTQENDVLALMNYMYARRTEYAISNKWVLLGASAGGHLAMLQGYKYTSPIVPKAIVNYFGPSDMVDTYQRPQSIFVDTSSFRTLLSGTPTSNPASYYQSSPINFVSAQSPATITFQGTNDILVPVRQQDALHAKLTAAGVPNVKKIYSGEGHGFTAAAMADSYVLVKNFIDTYVR